MITTHYNDELRRRKERKIMSTISRIRKYVMPERRSQVPEKQKYLDFRRIPNGNFRMTQLMNGIANVQQMPITFDAALFAYMVIYCDDVYCKILDLEDSSCYDDDLRSATVIYPFPRDKKIRSAIKSVNKWAYENALYVIDTFMGLSPYKIAVFGSKTPFGEGHKISINPEMLFEKRPPLFYSDVIQIISSPRLFNITGNLSAKAMLKKMKGLFGKWMEMLIAVYEAMLDGNIEVDSEAKEYLVKLMMNATIVRPMAHSNKDKRRMKALADRTYETHPELLQYISTKYKGFNNTLGVLRYLSDDKIKLLPDNVRLCLEEVL